MGAILVLAAFILPIFTLMRLSEMARRLNDVERLIDRQQSAIDELARQLRQWRRDFGEAPRPAAAADAVARAAAAAPPSVAPQVLPPPPAAATPPPTTAKPPATPTPTPQSLTTPPAIDVTAKPTVAPLPPKPAAPPPAPPPPPPRVSVPHIDWEQFIGVKMFSAIAGVALVLAAVFFLRYSIDQGWLVPQIRVAIGVITGVGLLAICDLRAARKYPITANALDAAAIAILFATFFAAHALWHLIPVSAAFALLALVTAVAVLLSIRRDSLFIAVLGLLGGFATPALLSTGENRPVPLFAYLLLLNVGLAWVASRKGWSVLTFLTLIFTTIYQWGWVMRFLTVSQLSLAMGIFLVFAVMGLVGVVSGTRAPTPEAERARSRTATAAAAMPLLFAAYLAAVPGYGAQPALLFGFLLMVDGGLLALAIARRDGLPHTIGAVAAVLVFAVWLAASYAHGAWTTAVGFTAAFVVLFAMAPALATRLQRPIEGTGARAVYAAPVMPFVFAVIAGIEPAVDAPFGLFAPLFALLLLITWRAFARNEFGVYFVAAFFALAAEAAWSARHLTIDHLRGALALYAAFGAFYLGVPVAARRLGHTLAPRWGSGAVLIVSLLLLLFLSAGSVPVESVWGLAMLLAILNAGVFVESAAGRLPAISVAAGAVSWLVLAVWWANAAGAAGVLPSLLFLVVLTLTMLGGHAWAHRYARTASDIDRSKFGFRQGTYFGLLGHLFLFLTAIDSGWSTPPWPLFGALTVLTLALTATSLAVYAGALHAAGLIAAAIIVFAWAGVSAIEWAPTMIVAAEAVAAHGLFWVIVMRRRGAWLGAAVGAVWALFMANLTLGEAAGALTPVPVAVLIAAATANIALLFVVAWARRWDFVAPAAVVGAWWVQSSWHVDHAAAAEWASSLAFAAALYLMFVAYPVVLGRRARGSRDPYLTAIAGSAWFFFAARAAVLQGGLGQYAGAIPVVEGLMMAVLLRQLVQMESAGSRDLGRLALVAATALGFATIAIPLQLNQQWITIGWALEGAALAWTYRRIPHRGLLYWASALFAIVFVRLAANPSIFFYQPRGYRVFNWYLYAYALCAAAMFLGAYWFSATNDRIADRLPRASALLPAGGVILLFLLLNIEIADFYATGPEITFRFGVTLAQDLTYTIGWLLFGLLLLTAGIFLHSRAARITAVALSGVTAFKAFLYDIGSLGGLYRVVSLVGLAISLALVAVALQKFVLQGSKGQS